MWKSHSLQTQFESHEITLLDALQITDSEFFPNIHSILKLVLTLQVGSVPCERSFSAIWRLNNWSRSTTAESRLIGLALLFIHRDMTISLENILNCFDATGHHKIGRPGLTCEAFTLSVESSFDISLLWFPQ